MAGTVGRSAMTTSYRAGFALSRVSRVWTKPAACNLQLDSDEVLYLRSWGVTGRIRSDASSEFANVLVIVDETKVIGSSFPALADYLAMLVLSRTELAGCSELPSITNLF